MGFVTAWQKRKSPQKNAEVCFKFINYLGRHTHTKSCPFGTGVLQLIQINHQPDATIFQSLSSWWWAGKRPKHVELQTNVRIINWKLLHQVGDLFELTVKLRCLKVKIARTPLPSMNQNYIYISQVSHNVRPLFYQTIIGYCFLSARFYRVQVLYSFDSLHDLEQWRHRQYNKGSAHNNERTDTRHPQEQIRAASNRPFGVGVLTS